MYNYKNSKLGMTLVEMVISLVILSILVTSTMGIIISSNNIFISTSKSVLDKQVGNTVYTLMEKMLKYTTHLQIVDEDDRKLNQSLSIEETDSETKSGIIKYRKGDEVLSIYDDGFYGGRTIQYSVDQYGSDGRHVRLTVNVFREGKRVYQRSSIIRCVNLALIGGSNGNSIVNSAASAFNQILSFSAKEELWAGGDSAWSVEYKAANFMAQYNKILKEYYDKLNPICTDYMNTINQYDNTNQNRISKTDLESAISDYQNQVFGGVQHEMYVPGKNMNTVYGEEKNAEGKYVNLRTYYQKQIYDLLKFTPTAAFPTATNPQVNKQYAKNNNDNPYYGVVATKEELYAGFLLSNYDADGNNKVTKDEYPSFDNPEDFFGSSTLGVYGIPTSTNKQNKMVILGYFNDNTDDKYGIATEIKADSTKSKLIDTVSKTVEYYENESATYDKDNWAVSSIFKLDNGFDSSTATIVTSLDIPTDKQIKFNNISVDHFTMATTHSKDSHFGKDKFTWNGSYSNTNRSITKSSEVVGSAYGWSVSEAYGDLSDIEKAKYLSSNTVISNLGIESILDYADLTTTSSSTKATSGFYTGEINWRLFTANKDIPEGWYYYNDEGSYQYAYYCFYLKANDTKHEDESLNKDSVAIANGKTLHLLSKDWDLKYLAYNQAEYILGKIKSDEKTIDFYTPYLHQYQDWVLYGVDWNSWFAINSGTTGLLNNLILGVQNWIYGIFNPDNVKSDLTGVSTSEGDGGIIISPDAILSLGATGQIKVNSTDSDIRSYNSASMVYHSGRGTWYYLPQNTTRLSVWKDSKTIFSDKDTPFLLNVEFRTGDQWENSTALQSDINNRKLSSSALWGILDTTSDVNWTALPADNSGVTNSKITINDVELSPAFSTNQKTYTAETTSEKNVITATYVTNDYKSDEISISITNNGKEVSNSSAIKWSQGTNTVVVKVEHVYEVKNGFKTETKRETLTTYTITVTKK